MVGKNEFEIKIKVITDGVILNQNQNHDFDFEITI